MRFHVSDQELNNLLVEILQYGGGFNVVLTGHDSSYKTVVFDDTILPEDIENIYNLGVRNLSVTQYEMALLTKLKKLAYIRFVASKFYGDVFAPLKNSMICELYIAYSEVEGISGRSVPKLKNLEVLGLTHSVIPDEFYKECNSLNINDLGISEIPVRVENLKNMLPLPNLLSLMLLDTRVGDDITDFLDELPYLETLIISFSLPNEMRCEFIRNMKNTDNIEIMEIRNTNVDDDILSAITRFKNLTSLTIRNSKITKDSIPMLKAFADGKRSIRIKNDDGVIFDSKSDWMYEDSHLEHSEDDSQNQHNDD